MQFLSQSSLDAADVTRPLVNTVRLTLQEASGGFELQSDLDGEAVETVTTDFYLLPDDVYQALEAISGRNQMASSRRGAQLSVDPVIGLRSRLFSALLRMRSWVVYQSFRLSKRPVSRLRLVVDAPTGSWLDELPWEFLYDPIRVDFPRFRPTAC